MFGFEQLFDFDRNGKLDTFECATEMAFLYSAAEAFRKSDRRHGDLTGFDLYGCEDCIEEDDNDWEDN